MTRQRQRLGLLVLGMAALGGAVALVLTAFSSNLVFFYSPSELAAHRPAPGGQLRIGGLVEAGSLTRRADGGVAFRVTDGKTDLAIAYRGILPDLFREGQGVVVEGALRPDGVFAAATVLAKHDERYMPREVVEALKKTGHWQEDARRNAAYALPSPSSLDAAARKAGRSSQP
jgi:cytochrome c-type biogenesis protein CcmE